MQVRLPSLCRSPAPPTRFVPPADFTCRGRASKFGSRTHVKSSCAVMASPSVGSVNGPKVLSREILGASPWLQLVDLKYTTDGSNVKSWQAAERTTTAPGGIDAVASFTVIKKRGAAPRLLIVKQFRPPIGRFTVELCAGLIDAGESPEVAALRELKEETGYTGRIVSSTGRQYLSPGLSPENIVTVFVEVDGDAPENQHPVQQEEDAGLITLSTLSLTDLSAELRQLEEQGFAIWAGLWSFAQGMTLSTLMPGLGL